MPEWVATRALSVPLAKSRARGPPLYDAIEADVGEIAETQAFRHCA